jgi:hypothetical protein
MDPVILILALIAVLVFIDLAATHAGVDTRDGFGR